MSDRDTRLARNEDHFRDINESLRDKHVHGTVVRSGPLPFVCECASVDCTEAVELTLDEYRRVRRNPRWFVVLPGHELPDGEVIVDSTTRYVAVEKVGELGRVARELDRDESYSDPSAGFGTTT
jgi:hypothetical protein